MKLFVPSDFLIYRDLGNGCLKVFFNLKFVLDEGFTGLHFCRFQPEN
jgi:hypothetical protein